MPNSVIEKKRNTRENTIFGISLKNPLIFKGKPGGKTEGIFQSTETDIDLLGILTAFVENSSAIIFIKSSDGKYLLANENLAALFELPKEKILGRYDREFLPAEYIKQFKKNAGKIIEGNRTVHFEEEVEIKGKTRYFHSIRFPVKFSEQYPDAIGCILVEVTDKRHTEEKLEATKTALIVEQVTLRKKNIALKELISQIESEKKLIKRRIKTNIDSIVSPLLENLKQRVDPDSLDHIKLLESSLNDIAAPFIRDLEKSNPRMSPRETEICNMIKNGLSSKDIARTLGVSVQTVIKQRKQIRKKLGINNSPVNLASYLKSL